MRVYAVFEPPSRDAGPGADLLRHAERFRFVRDGFSWPAFLFTPLWMLRYRLWLALVVYVAILAGLGFATARGLVPRGVGSVAVLLLSFLIGFEGATLRRRKLQRWRWRDLGIVVAENLQAAEQRFFDRWVTQLGPMAPSTGAAAPGTSFNPPPVPASGTAPGAPPAPGAAATRTYDSDSYVIGMLPTPGGQR